MEISPNVHHLPGVTGGNVYLLVGSTLTLVDTGLPDNAAAILSYIDSLGRSAADLTLWQQAGRSSDRAGRAAPGSQVWPAGRIGGCDSPQPAPHLRQVVGGCRGVAG